MNEKKKDQNITADHGKVVKIKWEPNHGVYVYEDGYEKRFYIGEKRRKK